MEDERALVEQPLVAVRLHVARVGLRPAERRESRIVVKDGEDAARRGERRRRGGDQGAGGVWVTRQLSVNRSGLTVVLQADLLARRGAFHFVNPLNASLLSFVTSKHAPRMTADVALVGDTKALGRRPTITMWRDDYSNATPGVEYVKAEQRHGVQFDGVRNAHASDVDIRSTGG